VSTPSLPFSIRYTSNQNNIIFNINKNKIKNINKNQNNIKNIKKHNKKRKNDRCNYCGKMGHYYNECLFRNNNNNNNKYKKNKYNNKFKYTNKRKLNKKVIRKNINFINIDKNNSNYNTNYADYFSNDYNSDNPNEINYISKPIINTINNSSKRNSISCWILDSGASINITNNINLLSDIKNCNEYIQLANGKSILSKQIGNFRGFINNNEFIIKNVYFSKEINKNLISVCQLTQQNYKIIFNTINNKPCAIIYDKNGKRIYNSYSNNSNTFKVWILTHKFNSSNNEINIANLKSSEKLSLWHRRLAHFNIENIKTKLLKINIPIKCPLCSCSKLKNKPYKPAINKSKHIFELIHMDLVGPISTSLYGNSYFLSILDDFFSFQLGSFLKK